MVKYIFNQIDNPEFCGIITVLDYEIHLKQYLNKLVIPTSSSKGKKAIVDLALKSGLDEFRFISLDIDNNGKLLLNSNSYIQVSKEIEKIANHFLKSKETIVCNSFLTDSQKKKILLDS